MCAFDFGTGGYASVCVCVYLFLCFILGPRSLTILLAQGLLLLVVQQGVVFVVTRDLVLIVLQHLSQEEILRRGKMTKRWWV